jgi:hypothetical protein
MKKISYNDMKTKGFETRPQMRYLLQLARKYPDRFSWVYDVLKNHGVPSEETALNTYWSGPYNVSPETPSYTYTGRKGSMLEKIIKLAQAFDDNGNASTAKKLDTVVVRSVMIDQDAAEEVANMFWTIRKNELPKDPEMQSKWFERLQSFEPFQGLNRETQEESERILGDKILGR